MDSAGWPFETLIHINLHAPLVVFRGESTPACVRLCCQKVLLFARKKRWARATGRSGKPEMSVAADVRRRILPVSYSLLRLLTSPLGFRKLSSLLGHSSFSLNPEP
jgi:hypothetical protein